MPVPMKEMKCDKSLLLQSVIEVSSSLIGVLGKTGPILSTCGFLFLQWTHIQDYLSSTLVLTLFWEMPDFCTAHSVSMNQFW